MLYVLIVEVLILREVRLARLPALRRDSMVLVGGVLIILGVAMASTNYLVAAGVPMRLFEFIKAHVDDRLAFLTLLNVFLLALGMILDIFSALVLWSPCSCRSRLATACTRCTSASCSWRTCRLATSRRR